MKKKKKGTIEPKTHNKGFHKGQQHISLYPIFITSAYACLFSFEQFIEQQMVQFQDLILKHLHHHIFFNIFFDEIFKAHHVQI
jgi:hypothetical protein